MRLFFMKVLFLYCVYDSCKGLGPSKEGAEIVESDDILTKNGSAISAENSLKEFLHEQPVAVVVELKEPLLEKVKAILRQESETNFPIQGIALATFDSIGLQDVSLYNDSYDIIQAIMDLEPTANDREFFNPTIRVLGELLQKGIPEGSILLVTMSGPSDEIFAENLLRSLMGNRSQLSILWAGNNQSEEYLLLKNIAERSGGKFSPIESLDNSDENAVVEQFPKSETNNLYAQIKFPEEQNGTTEKEIPMVSRAADQKVLPKTVVPLIIEVASGEILEVRPGTPTSIQFTVKNNLNLPLHVTFSARFNGIVQRVQPPRAFLQPSDTATVTVHLFPTNAAQSVSALGTLTLLAEAANKITGRSALISMTPQTITDYTAPKMTYKYDGDCANYREPHNCEQGRWNLEVTLQDEDSGLLKVLSEPYGLLFQSEFIAGMKSPVTVYNTATCCQPNVIIWAEDLKGNYVKKSFDVFNQNLLASEIAGIVLGVLLLLFIIIAIIVAVVLVKRRNRRNMIIPRARSGSSVTPWPRKYIPGQKWLGQFSFLHFTGCYFCNSLSVVMFVGVNLARY